MLWVTLGSVGVTGHADQSARHLLAAPQPAAMRSTLAALALVLAVASAWDPPAFCNKLDCPIYAVEKKAATYEIRRYQPCAWASINVTNGDMTYQQVVRKGFMSLFQYISGANVAHENVEMAAPVSVDIFPGAGPACNTTFTVSFFVPFADQADPVAPTDANVYIRRSPERLVAVRAFSGWTNNFTSEVLPNIQQLGADLTAAGLDFDSTTQTVNGYDSPFKSKRRCRRAGCACASAHSACLPCVQSSTATTKSG
jgi:hypothetical protein